MARSSIAGTGNGGTRVKAAAAPEPASPAPRAPEASAPKPAAIDTAGLSLDQLAEAVLAGNVKPRIADIRRLASGVLELGNSDKSRKVKDGKSKKDKAKQKLAKIPGQKKKKPKG